MGLVASSWGRLAAALLSCLVGCGDSDGGGEAGFGNGGCLSNAEICQFERGVSTRMDVEDALGNAQTYLGPDTSVYVCQQVAGMQVIHNDLVVFDFDEEQRLYDVMVLRQGTGATPPPDCESPEQGAAGGFGGSGVGGFGADACAAVPRPAPDTTTCQGASFGEGTQVFTTTCTDQDGSKWASTCSRQACTCSHNDVAVCECNMANDADACCPGLPGAPLP